MKEKDVQVKFGKWIKENYPRQAAWELKLIKNSKPLSFKSFRPQQIPSLRRAKFGCVYKKLSDMDPGLKPFDALQICNAEAYIVACWWHEGVGVRAYWIDVEDFVEEQETCGRKSLKEKRAMEIAKKIIIL